MPEYEHASTAGPTCPHNHNPLTSRAGETAASLLYRTQPQPGTARKREAHSTTSSISSDANRSSGVQAIQESNCACVRLPPKRDVLAIDCAASSAAFTRLIMKRLPSSGALPSSSRCMRPPWPSGMTNTLTSTSMASSSSGCCVAAAPAPACRRWKRAVLLRCGDRQLRSKPSNHHSAHTRQGLPLLGLGLGL